MSEQDGDLDSSWFNDPELKSLYQQALQSIKTKKSVTGSPIPNHISKCSHEQNISLNSSRSSLPKYPIKPYYNNSFNNLVVLTGNNQESPKHSYTVTANSETKSPKDEKIDSDSRFNRKRHSSDESDNEFSSRRIVASVNPNKGNNNVVKRQSSFKEKRIDDNEDAKSLSDVSVVDIALGDFDSNLIERENENDDNNEEIGEHSANDFDDAAVEESSVEDIDQSSANDFDEDAVLNLCDPESDDCEFSTKSRRISTNSDRKMKNDDFDLSPGSRSDSRSSDSEDVPVVSSYVKKKRKKTSIDKRKSETSKKSKKHKKKKKRSSHTRRDSSESPKRSESPRSTDFPSRISPVSHSISSRRRSHSPDHLSVRNTIRSSIAVTKRTKRSVSRSGSDDLRKLIEQKRAKR